MKTKIIVISILILHFFLLLGLKFTAWPEMLLWPYLITKGWLPYVNLAIAHTPHLLISLALAFKIFGAGVMQLKIYTWILIILTDCIVFFVANKFWRRKVALLSLLAFVVWQLFYDGNGLWFDLILVPLSLITFYFLHERKYLWTGILWAITFFTKQTAVWFAIPIVVSLIGNKKRSFGNLGRFGMGTAITILVAILGLWLWRVLPAFYEWAIKFGIFVLPRAQGQIQLPDLRSLLIATLPFSLFIPFLFGKEKSKWSLILWAFAGTLGAYPRFELFHFQPAIPFLAFVVGLTLSKLKRFRELRSGWGIFIAVYLLGSLYLFAGFFMRNWQEGTRFYEQDVQDVVLYIKANTAPGDKIFVMNWWDNLYPLTDTLPATNPWIPQLSWYMELPGIQDKMIQDLSTTKPKFIIFNPYSDSGSSVYVPAKLNDFVQTNYKLKDRIDGVKILVLKK